MRKAIEVFLKGERYIIELDEQDVENLSSCDDYYHDIVQDWLYSVCDLDYSVVELDDDTEEITEWLI